MAPKEKAQELVHKYITLTDGWVYGKENWEHKKKCALIAVNEIIANIEPSVSMDVIEARVKYWQQVQKEIEKL